MLSGPRVLMSAMSYQNRTISILLPRCLPNKCPTSMRENVKALKKVKIAGHQESSIEVSLYGIKAIALVVLS